MNDNQIRKLPKKTVIIIGLIALLSIVGFIFIQQTKSLKMEEVLKTLGYKNISDIKVINKLSVEDKQTKIKSTVYKVTFFDETLKKECIGFVHRSNDGKKYEKDFDCK